MVVFLTEFVHSYRVHVAKYVAAGWSCTVLALGQQHLLSRHIPGLLADFPGLFSHLPGLLPHISRVFANLAGVFAYIPSLQPYKPCLQPHIPW